MKNKTDKPKTLATRRTFIKSTGAAASGLFLTPASFSFAGSAKSGKEILALNGGPKAVTTPLGDAAFNNLASLPEKP